MSGKDARLLGVPTTRIIENGVDLTRFQPEPERPGQRLLFVGSFNHFPNVEAFRFFRDAVWPKLRRQFPGLTLTVVAGRNHELYWRQFTGELAPPREERISVLDFVRDVRPLYVECNLVIVPTTVSAGTNLKVLEAMAMERAVVSTSCGCAGLGLEHGVNVCIADDADSFVEAVARLIANPPERARMTRAAKSIVVQFDWKQIGRKQRALYRELLGVGSANYSHCNGRQPAFGYASAAWYYKILISSRAATISWWDRRFRLSLGCASAAQYHKILISSRAAPVSWWDRRFRRRNRLSHLTSRRFLQVIPPRAKMYKLQGQADSLPFQRTGTSIAKLIKGLASDGWKEMEQHDD
jgi:hypothetical protein